MSIVACRQHVWLRLEGVMMMGRRSIVNGLGIATYPNKIINDRRSYSFCVSRGVHTCLLWGFHGQLNRQRNKKHFMHVSVDWALHYNVTESDDPFGLHHFVMSWTNPSPDYDVVFVTHKTIHEWSYVLELYKLLGIPLCLASLHQELETSSSSTNPSDIFQFPNYESTTRWTPSGVTNYLREA